MSIETVRILRNAADKNIKKYCKESGESFSQVRKEIYQMADEYNTKLPTDFYKEVYNLSITMLNPFDENENNNRRTVL